MRRGRSNAVASVLSVLLALALGFLAVALTKDPGTAARAFGQMFTGGLGDWGGFLDGGRAALVLRPLGEAGVRMALLLLAGLSVAVAYQAGLFNIGAQGQLTVGALAAAVVGAHVPLPGGLHPLAALLAGAVVGAAWGLVAAGLKVGRGVHEVISTIMLNWVAVSLVDNWLVTGPLRAPAAAGTSRSGTTPVLETAELPRLFPDAGRLHAGLLVALVAAVGVGLWLRRTRHGYEVRAVGQAPEAARAAGIPVGRRTLEAMALAGALAGLAGGVLVLGTEKNYPSTVGAPYGFDGIAIALIGGGGPLGATLASAFFGVLRAGGTRMQLEGVHKSFPELIQGLALLLVAGKMLWSRLLARRVRPAVAPAPAQGGTP